MIDICYVYFKNKTEIRNELNWSIFIETKFMQLD